MPTKKDIEMLKRNGWTVECERPFEIRHEDGSFASGQAAIIVTRDLQEQEPPLCVECGEIATNTTKTFCDEHEHLVF